MKIAVVSDNIYMAHAFKNILAKQMPHVSAHYFCSTFSNPKEFNIQNVQSIDIKKYYTNLIEKFNLIFSIHCKQIFPKELVERVRCINVHPGYNPINRGWYPQVFSIINNLETGATIHEMDAELDHGNIIARKKIAIKSWDTSLSLYNKIVETELELLEKHIISIVEKTYTTITPESEGNVYLKKDFNALLHIDLQKKASYKQVINHLRALTHGEFKNAYFVDSETNKKVFVKVILEVEHE
ncbi:MAG: dTDP-4-amino-4,6-dideoxyglucose formyltransferase [Bacteroidales bacterium]|nr:dTDP-4-amino-4,6-dideoxyglucose formyltransferase [Bacteroidales bacterium]